MVAERRRKERSDGILTNALLPTIAILLKHVFSMITYI